MAIIIVAANEDGVIGRGHAIPWHLKEDLKHFRTTTEGHVVIMGRRTWDTIPPYSRPLPNRVNYIISRQDIRIAEPQPCGPFFFKSLSAAMNDALKHNTKIFIMGGAEIYKLALQAGYVDQILFSQVKGHHEGDKFFSIPPNFQEIHRERRAGFDIVTYEPIDNFV